MKPGQTLKKWWSDLVQGAFKTPSDLFRVALSEVPTASDDRFFSIPQDVATWQAPQRLKAPRAFITHTIKQYERADWQHVDPRLMRWAALFCEYARKRDIPLYVHSAFRSEAEQAALLAKGRTKAAYPNSAHNIGEAVDIVHSVYHWELTRDEWALLHVLGKRALARINATLLKKHQFELTWGGNWSFYDPAHWEISDFRTRRRPLSAGLPIRASPRRILNGFPLETPYDLDAELRRLGLL